MIITNSWCLNLQFSKFAAKLVNLYITTFRYDEWEKFAQELQVIWRDEIFWTLIFSVFNSIHKLFLKITIKLVKSYPILQDMDLTVGNFTETLSSVDRRIQVMRQFQQLSRGLEARDFNLLMSNINYVNTWYVLKKFFERWFVIFYEFKLRGVNLAT